MRYFVSILVLHIFDGEERAGCVALFVCLVSRDCCAALPHDGTALSAVCDCGISGMSDHTHYFCTTIDLPAKRHSMAFRWWADSGPLSLSLLE